VTCHIGVLVRPHIGEVATEELAILHHTDCHRTRDACKLGHCHARILRPGGEDSHNVGGMHCRTTDLPRALQDYVFKPARWSKREFRTRDDLHSWIDGQKMGEETSASGSPAKIASRIAVSPRGARLCR
jgi:hypothetical protein